MWAPDVYQGSPTSVTAFFALLPKVAAMTVLIRILYVPFLNMLDQWQLIVVFLSIASMIGMTYNPITKRYKLEKDVSVNYLTHYQKK